MIQYKKILMTLALLITAVTGAWADGIVCTASDLGKVLCTDGSIYENVTAATTANKTAAAVIAYVDETNKNGLAIALADEGSTMNWSTAVSTCESKTPTVTGAKWCLPSQDQWNKMVTAAGSYENLKTNAGLQSDRYWSSTEYDADARCAWYFNFDGGNWYDNLKESKYRVRACLAFAITDPNAVEVKWDAATKTGTFVMPAFDVEIDPIYAPVAVLATDGKPTAIEGIIAGEAKDIVKAGTVAKVGSTENAQGTVMYLTTTDANMTKEQARDAVTGWTSTVPTGAVLTGSYAEDQTVYVWYYIKGIDAAEGVTPTAENTFNDSEICTTPLPVTLKANQFDLIITPAPVSNATVTVAGTAATAEQLNTGKIEKAGTGSEVKLKANEGYKIKKVVVKEKDGDNTVTVTINEAKTEATFTMPTYDVTASYELIRDMAVKMPVTIGDGKDGYHVRLKKDGDKWELADLTNEQLMAKVKVHDAIEEKDLPFYGNDAVCDAKIYALGNDGKPTGDAITLATMAPGSYVIIATAKENSEYYEGKAISNTFVLYQGYEVTVGAGEYATYYKDEALYTEDENAELYTIASVTDTEAVLSDQIKVAPAKTPLLIYNKGEKDMTFILLPTEEQADAITAADQFKGTLAAKDMPASTEGEDYYVCTGKEFVWVRDAGTIAANKCWIEIIAQAAGARSNTRSITIGGDTTGIDAATRDDIDGDYYDLQGRKVVKPNSKGIYIHNGKKVIKH